MSGAGEERKLVHLSLNVQHFLQHAQRQDYERTFVDADGVALDWHIAQHLLLRELELGHLFLPITACDNFSHETGCRGHAL